MKKLIKFNIKKNISFNNKALTLFFLIKLFISTTNLMALTAENIDDFNKNNNDVFFDVNRKGTGTLEKEEIEEVLNKPGMHIPNKLGPGILSLNSGDNLKLKLYSYRLQEDENNYSLYYNDITYSLNPNLTGIKSISGPANNGVKLTFNDNELSLNDKKITGLAEGTSDNDAVSFKQLKKVETKVDAIKKELENKGNITSKTLTLTNNTGRIFSGPDLTIELKENSIEEKHLNEPLRTKIDNAATKEELKKVDAKADENKKSIEELSNIAVKYDDKTKKEITLGGTKYAPVSLKNVKDGTDKNDAVNYGQLKDIVSGDIKLGETKGVSGDKIYKEFEKVRMEHTKQLSGGIATAMAMSGIPQVGDNKLFSIGFGTAYYNKQGGFAVGISGTEKTNTFIYKISAGMDTQKTFGISAGFNINLIRNGSKNILNKVYVTDPKVQNQMKLMQEKLTELEAKLSQQASGFKEKLYIIDQFINDKYIPTKLQIKKLEFIVKEINEKYSDRIIDITGHTDINANEKYNLELGFKRANKIAELLISLGLKNPQNIRKVSSFGYNNKISDSLDINRRVEIIIK